MKKFTTEGTAIHREKTSVVLCVLCGENGCSTVFHSVETFFPLCGKIAKKFSILWKTLVDEAGLEEGIGAENGFGFGEAVAGGEDGVKVLFDGGGDLYGL